MKIVSTTELANVWGSGNLAWSTNLPRERGEPLFRSVQEDHSTLNVNEIASDLWRGRFLFLYPRRESIPSRNAFRWQWVASKHLIPIHKDKFERLLG